MRTDTVIIGAGQAGLALSHELRAAGLEHVLLERGRVGERWRSERWDSLRLLTPNRLNGLPGAAALPEPGGYLDRASLVAHLESYASDAPVRAHTTVVRVRWAAHGYDIATDRGDWRARNVVIATGDCDVPRVPAAAAAAPASVHQLHAARYRRPDELPDGWVLVVGAGPSGQQIAAELRRAGREVVLAVGRHARMPRRYRGRDIFDWLLESGQLDVGAAEVPDLTAARRAPSFPVSGAGSGGESLGLDRLAELGVTVTGRLLGFAGRHALFAAEHLEREAVAADRRMRRTLDRVDAHIARGAGTRRSAPAAGTRLSDPGADTRLSAPGAAHPGPTAHPAAFQLPAGPSRLDLGAGVGTILWATGYGRSYPWLEVPVLDDAGELVHCEGVTAAPGLFALGLRFQRTRRSHFLGGVGADAAFIAAEIERRAGGAGLLARAA